MAYAQTISTPVFHTDEDTRARFIARVYQHIGLAVLAFIGFEYILFATGVAERMAAFFFDGSAFRWVGLLLVVSLGNTIVSQSAHNLSNIRLQYAGLFGSAALEAVIFAPFLFYISRRGDAAATIGWAAVITLVGFAVLSVIAYTTQKDFSFLRPILMWGAIAAFGLIVASAIFDFNLGLLFSVAMVGLSGGLILYKTQQVAREYPSEAYVGAAVALFASLMMMFWYVLRIVASFRD